MRRAAFVLSQQRLLKEFFNGQVRALKLFSFFLQMEIKRLSKESFSIKNKTILVTGALKSIPGGFIAGDNRKVKTTISLLRGL